MSDTLPRMAALSATATPPLPSPGLYADRYELLDAWRGLAALAVVVHHVTPLKFGGPAVMVFFVISGYCIAASADACQRKGWGFGGFMARRIRRIYPPYLFSLAYWAAMRLTKWKLLSGANDLNRSPVEWLQNATLTQWLTLLRNPLPRASANPTLFVPAYWSLCYEEQFYLIMGLMVLACSLMRASILPMSLALMAVGLVWNAIWPQMCFGIFIEYWCHFAIGVVIFHRLCRVETSAIRHMIDGGTLILFAACVYLGWFHTAAPPGVDEAGIEFRMVYQELAQAFGFGLLLIAMRPASAFISKSKAFKPLLALGHITFSLYLIHGSNLTLMPAIAYKLLGFVNHLAPPTAEQPWPSAWMWTSMIIQLFGHVAIATVFWYFCERPFLNKPLGVPKPDAQRTTGHSPSQT